jgi:hypothetical protein
MSQPDTCPCHYHVSYQEPQGVAKQMDKRYAGRLKAQLLQTRYPLFIARHPELPDRTDPSYHLGQDNSDSSPFGPSLDDIFEESAVPSPSSSTQLGPAECPTEVWIEKYQADLMKRSQARFDPRLLTLTFNSDHSQGFTSNRQAAIDWVASGPAAILDCLASLPTASNGYLRNKKSFIQKFVIFTELLRSRMYGDAAFRFQYNDSTFLQPNSALAFADGHGGERLQNEPVLKPDLVIVEGVDTGGAAQYWHQIHCAAGVSVMVSADFSTGDPDQQKNIVPRILAYKVFVYLVSFKLRKLIAIVNPRKGSLAIIHSAGDLIHSLWLEPLCVYGRQTLLASLLLLLLGWMITQLERNRLSTPLGFFLRPRLCITSLGPLL